MLGWGCWGFRQVDHKTVYHRALIKRIVRGVFFSQGLRAFGLKLLGFAAQGCELDILGRCVSAWRACSVTRFWGLKGWGFKGLGFQFGVSGIGTSAPDWRCNSDRSSKHGLCSDMQCFTMQPCT